MAAAKIFQHENLSYESFTTRKFPDLRTVCMYVYVYVCMYNVCMYVCMYIRCT